MTVVVGILNKRGVAIAADSATSNNILNNNKINKEEEKEKNVVEKKVVNSGNKMLRLSDHMPIGVMIVGNAQISGIPWDIIIRWYRKQLGNKTFSSVLDAAKNLLSVLEGQDFFNEAASVYIYKYQDPTQLVFAGYGSEQQYPQLVNIDITGVKEGGPSINANGEYYSQFSIKHNIVSHCVITDNHPSEICYFGQNNIAAALTDDITENTEIHQFCLDTATIIQNKLKELSKEGLIDITDMPDHHFYHQGMLSVFMKYNEDSHQQWLDAIEHYTLQEMAALAENLINATELYHKLMCLDESVGGLIDLAVITREDGFQWLNRKSWYEPSKGGQYGKFGI